MHRLQTIAHIGKSARDDDAHRVVDVRVLHLVLEIHRHDFALTKIHNLTS